MTMRNMAPHRLSGRAPGRAGSLTAGEPLRQPLLPRPPQRRTSLLPPQAREPPRMRNLRGGGGGGAQYGAGTVGGTAPPVADGAARSSKPNSGINSNVNSSRPLYRGNLSGTGNDTRPTTAVTPEDVLAATQAENAAAAATVASASKPVVKFVPKRISLFDAMKFNGPAPEIINSRLAMVGFLAGTVRETHTGEPLLQQALQLGPGTWFWLALIVVASLQPITKAAKSEPFGWFTPRAEIVNGRAAMLGFGIVAALEWHAGVCFF